MESQFALAHSDMDQANLETYRKERDLKREAFERIRLELEALDQIVSGFEKRVAYGKETPQSTTVTPLIVKTNSTESTQSNTSLIPLRTISNETVPQKVERYLKAASWNGLSFSEIEKSLKRDATELPPEKSRQTLHDTISNLRKKGYQIERVGPRGAGRYILKPIVTL